jgi:hypothetical protein
VPSRDRFTQSGPDIVPCMHGNATELRSVLRRGCYVTRREQECTSAGGIDLHVPSWFVASKEVLPIVG